MLQFGISIAGVSPSPLIDQLLGNCGLITVGYYKAAKLFVNEHVLAVFTSSCSLTLVKQFQLHGSVENEALKLSTNCNKQNESILLHFHLKNTEHLHSHMI